MSNHDEQNGSYKSQLHDLQVELVKAQRAIIDQGRRVLVIMEGRDTAGKDGTIKRIVDHLSPRDMRVVALSKPSQREQSSWYFQRWVTHLPAGGEIVFFNRSWYNRAGVERVMGFCTDEEYERFMDVVPHFESTLIRSGTEIIKYYLDISKDEQARRIAARHEDPLKQWKISPIDKVAQKKWDEYTIARDAMFSRTHTPGSPWYVVRNEHKRTGRINLIRHLLLQLPYEDKQMSILMPDPEIVFPYSHAARDSGLIAG